MLKQSLPFTLFDALILVTLTFAQATSDQSQTELKELEKIQDAIANYDKGLLHENQGVTESAIINIMRLKYNYPNYDYRTLVNHLENLENAGETKSIRFMAYIVKNYLLHPERFTWVEDMCCKHDQLFYSMISQKIHNQVGE